MNRGLWFGAWLLFVAALTTVWLGGRMLDRDAVLGRTQASIEATALLLEQHAARALEAGDRVLQALAALHDGGQSLDEAQGRRLLEQIHRLTEGSPQVTAAWIMNAEAQTLVESWGFPPRTQRPLPDRHYFQVHRTNPDQGLFIGPTEIGNATGRPRFTLSRGLRGPDGGFAGVVAVGVYSEYFANLYSIAPLMPGARLALSTQDGQPLAVWPPGARPARDGELTTGREVTGFPLRVSVSQPLNSVLADWRRRSWATGAVVALSLLCFGALTVLG
ncbi:MAG TPA: hypothetical protein VD970_07665, partial [Acetobacteraceae bacterium]|nr:hypothetical protein [Acetobacteraceae bacterium]